MLARQVRPPLEISQRIQGKIRVPIPSLKKDFKIKTLEEDLRNSGVFAFQHAPQPLTRDWSTCGLLGGSIDIFSDRMQKIHRELPQLEDLREITRLKIPHEEIKRVLS